MLLLDNNFTKQLASLFIHNTRTYCPEKCSKLKVQSSNVEWGFKHPDPTPHSRELELHMLKVPSSPNQTMILKIFTKLCFCLQLSSSMYGDNQPGTSPPVSSHSRFSPAKAYVNCYNQSAKIKHLIRFSFICNYMGVIKLFQRITKVKFSLSTAMVCFLLLLLFQCSSSVFLITLLKWEIRRYWSQNLPYSSCHREYELTVIRGKLEKAFPSCE